ncbi:MAG TPA: glycosyltransferase family 4 protein [Methanotrichaceae archaeon]|nr:glycosyltransferase family 4 protein [Methanotrichaceae archaeon]
MARKIVYVVPNLHENGGIQELAKAIYCELKDEFDLELVNWTNGLSLPVRALLRFAPDNVSAYIYVKYFSNRLRSKYNINDADLIHFWHIEPAMAFLDKNYIVSCLGMEVLPIHVKNYRELMYRNVLTNALVVHVISHYTKDIIKNQFDCPEETLELVPPCINYAKFSLIKKLELNDDVVVGTLSRFVKRKNIPNIIKSLNIVKNKYGLDFKYYLAGDGPERDIILNELSTAEFEWKYFGEISEEEKINDFYPSLDLFVMPPLELPNDVEGFGIVYLEANSYGIPVVASRSGGVTDAVQEGVSGVFADPIDPNDIALKISELIEDRNRYFESAKKWAIQFDAKKIAKNFSDIYGELLK